MLVGADEDRLSKEADRVDFDLKLDAEACIKKGKEMNIKLANAVDDAKVTYIDRSMWQNLYGKFDRNSDANPAKEDLYVRYENEEGKHHLDTLFKTTDRLKLTKSIVEAKVEFGGAGLSLNKNFADKKHPLSAFFPLHQTKQ